MSRADSFYMGWLAASLECALTAENSRRVQASMDLNNRRAHPPVFLDWLESKGVKLTPADHLAAETYREVIELIWPFKAYLSPKVEKSIEQVLWTLDNPPPIKRDKYIEWVEALDEIGEQPPVREQERAVILPSFKNQQ